VAKLAGRALAGRNSVDAFASRLLGFELEPELLAHHTSKKPAHRVLLPAVLRMMLAMVTPLGRLSSPNTRACLESARCG
jgi:hypothetical protein